MPAETLAYADVTQPPWREIAAAVNVAVWTHCLACNEVFYCYLFQIWPSPNYTHPLCGRVTNHHTFDTEWTPVGVPDEPLDQHTLRLRQQDSLRLDHTALALLADDLVRFKSPLKRWPVVLFAPSQQIQGCWHIAISVPGQISTSYWVQSTGHAVTLDHVMKDQPSVLLPTMEVDGDWPERGGVSPVPLADVEYPTRVDQRRRPLLDVGRRHLGFDDLVLIDGYGVYPKTDLPKELEPLPPQEGDENVLVRVTHAVDLLRRHHPETARQDYVRIGMPLMQSLPDDGQVPGCVLVVEVPGSFLAGDEPVDLAFVRANTYVYGTDQEVDLVVFRMGGGFKILPGSLEFDGT